MLRLFQNIALLFLLFLIGISTGASQTEYEVTRLNINDKHDDFGPQVWKNYLVFCSERQVRVFLVNYKDIKTKRGVTNIVSSKLLNDTAYSKPEIFSKSILSNHHDGPVSFTPDGGKIYYSRPLNISSKAKNRNNDSLKLGIFSAEYVLGTWADIRPLNINSTQYNVSMPAIAPDESYIIFASDHPDSRGYADLFISRNIEGTWTEPENLGPEINTAGREFFPFIHYNGDLYYSTNGKGGDRDDFDIYFCPFNGTTWEKPIRLGEPFNSEGDDYSFYINYSKRQGYFSSNREGPFDIYHFEKITPDYYECSPQIEETFCFDLPKVDESEFEGLPFKYVYVLNGQTYLKNEDQTYCFPDEGVYSIQLSAIDTLTETLIFDKERLEFLIERIRQPYIHIADTLPINRWVHFDAEGTYLPGVNRDEYVWDFGDNTSESGESVRHFYSTQGTYKVTLTIFGKPIGKVVPRFCSSRNVYVDQQLLVAEESKVNKPMDLAGFIRLADYTPLPDNLYYANLLKNKEEIKMSHILDTSVYVPLSDLRFLTLDTSRLHVFQQSDQRFHYYYGQAFNFREAYRDLLQSRSAGFSQAKITNLKNAKLSGEEFYIEESESEGIGFAVILKKSNKAVENYEEQFEEVIAMGYEVHEVNVPGEGYYYVTGNKQDINEALSVYQELKLMGVKSIRIKDFSSKSVVSSLSRKNERIATSQYMIELFRTSDYIEMGVTLFDILEEQKIIGIRQPDRKVAYFVNGGENLLAAKASLKKIREKGFVFSNITNFKYEKLDDEGYFISTVDEGEFSYVITFESKKNALDASTQLSSLLMGYNVVETYDPQTGTYRYQLDVGKELAEAIMLSNDLQNASVYIVSIEKLNYDPLTDEEFYLIPVEEGTEQFILVLGKYEEKQNIYKTFSHVRPFEEIREIYNAEDGVYTYIIGGYASLDEAYAAMENVKGIGLSNVYIRKFIYSPIDSDKFTLEEVNDELELYRLSVYKGNKKVSAGDPRFDGIREHGRLIDSYDPERDVFVVSLGGTKSLPKALNNLGAVLKQMDDSVSVERYIYSSFDKDRFAIREVDKKDEFYGIEILESEQPLPEDNEILKKLQRKYPIVSKYDEESHSYKYYIANINNYEGAQKYLEYAQQDGFVEAKIVIIVYETLGLEEFYIQPVEEEAFDYVINVLRTRSDLDLDDPYFADLPPDLKIDKIFDEKTGTYNYVVFSPPDINEANKILSAVKEAGYLFVHIDRMEYEPINPDLFQLVPIQESEEDFAVTLFRSKQQLGADHPRFDQIRQFGEIKEYYDNNTNEYIYSFGKAVGFKQAFRNMVIAKENGFEQATIGKFVYSDLNPDHFYLESIDHYEEMFTVILAESSERINSERFEAFESQGFIVREKYIESRGLWVYSLSMTKNVAEAENMATFAKEAGFENAKLSRFIYSPLSTDYYYLKSIDNDEELFMIVLKESEQQLDVNNDPYFANLTGKYPIKEVYDKERKIYKYYVGGSLKDLAYAESLQKELYALGYSEVTIVQFKFSALHFDEFYIQYIDDSGEVVFLFEKDKIVKLITVYFGFDQYYLDKKSRLQIDTLVQKFRGINFRILLEGRTDDIGESEYNKWLGHKRAESVKKYLLQYGISEERIKVVSLGEKDPIAPNINLENRRKNRSVRIIPEIP